jgi:hypothetical protein
VTRVHPVRDPRPDAVMPAGVRPGILPAEEDRVFYRAAQEQEAIRFLLRPDHTRLGSGAATCAALRPQRPETHSDASGDCPPNGIRPRVLRYWIAG